MHKCGRFEPSPLRSVLSTVLDGSHREFPKCRNRSRRNSITLRPTRISETEREYLKRADLAPHVGRPLQHDADWPARKPADPRRAEPVADVSTRLPWRTRCDVQATREGGRAEEQEDAVISDLEPGQICSATERNSLCRREVHVLADGPRAGQVELGKRFVQLHPRELLVERRRGVCLGPGPRRQVELRGYLSWNGPLPRTGAGERDAAILEQTESFGVELDSAAACRDVDLSRVCHRRGQRDCKEHRGRHERA